MTGMLPQAAQLVNQRGQPAGSRDLEGKTVLLYFSAHWCPPCRAFTPLLRDFYNALRAQGKPIEIVFVSHDRTAEEAAKYFLGDHGPWLALPWHLQQEGRRLSDAAGVRGIPHLAVLAHGGTRVAVPEQEAAHAVRTGGDPASVFARWQAAAAPQQAPAVVGAEAEEVTLYMYDLTRGAGPQLAQLLLGDHTDAIWRTAVVCWDREFYFDRSGISSATPGTTSLGAPVRCGSLGRTRRSRADFERWNAEQGQRGFGRGAFDPRERNWNHYSSAAAEFLAGRGTPPEVADQIDQLLRTPEGQRIWSIIDEAAGGSGGSAQARAAEAALSAPADATLAEVREQVAWLAHRPREGRPALETLNTILGNLRKSPQERKYRRLGLDKPAFRERVGRLPAAVAVLRACGFDRDPSGERALVFRGDPASVRVGQMSDLVAEGLAEAAETQVAAEAASQTPAGREAVEPSNGLQWLPLASRMPPSAIQCGKEANGQPLYAGRATLSGSTLPGKCGEHLGDQLHVAVDGQERGVAHQPQHGQVAEVLCAADAQAAPLVRWVRRSGDSPLPPRAVAAGGNAGGTLYVARAWWQDGLHPGMAAAHLRGGCILAWGGRAVPVAEHEVLCECSPGEQEDLRTPTLAAAPPLQPGRCAPLHSVEALMQGSAPCGEPATCPLLPRQATRDPSQGRLLVCHDMAGGYTDADKDAQGYFGDHSFYRLSRWHYVDAFVYFSHACVTVPPAGWANAAHRHGVPCLGTIITEGEQGARQTALLLQSPEQAAQRLSELAAALNFDGWLINIEHPLAKEQVPRLLALLRALTSRMHDINERSLVIYYDAVTRDGRLNWQNTLNQENSDFFDACDGIFTNYWWREGDPRAAAQLAGERKHDVYFGVDVFGSKPGQGQRVTYGGGGLDCHNALAKIREAGVSCALFAPAWTWEKVDAPAGAERLARFSEKDAAFWQKLDPFFKKCRVQPSSLPLVTRFGDGGAAAMHCSGRKVAGPCFNLSGSELRPQLPLPNLAATAGCAQVASLLAGAAYEGGTALVIKGRLAPGGCIAAKVFDCALPLAPDGLTVAVAVRGRQGPCCLFATAEGEGEGGTAAKHLMFMHFSAEGLAASTSRLHHYAPCSERQADGGWVLFEWHLAGLPEQGRLTALCVAAGEPGRLLNALLTGRRASKPPDEHELWGVSLGELRVRSGGGGCVSPLRAEVADVRHHPGVVALHLSCPPAAGRTLAHADVYAGERWLGRAYSPVLPLQQQDAPPGTALRIVAADSAGCVLPAVTFTLA